MKYPTIQSRGVKVIQNDHNEIIITPTFTQTPATLKQKLNNSVIHSTQGLPTYYNKLKPVIFGKRIGLSIGRVITQPCCICQHRYVLSKHVDEVRIWYCCECNAPRLAERQKPDNELISELLAHPRLTSFERAFIKTHSQKLGVWQRKRLQQFAQRLGLRFEENCSLSEVVGVEL